MSARVAVVTSGRIDDDNGSAAEQHAEEGRHVSGLVAQQDPDLSLPNLECLDGSGEPGDLTPRRPLTVVFDGCIAGLQLQHIGDAPAERVVGHQRTHGLASAP